MESSQIAGMLLRKEANVNFKNEYGITALYAAAFKRNVAMVELLLEHGADVNFITFYEEIFRKAKDAKKIEIALRLLKNGKIRHRSSASNSSAAIVMKRVAENWANINLMNELRIAAYEKHMNSNTIKILMEWGGKIDIESDFWKTIFCLINEMNNENVDNLFLHNPAIKRQFNRICNATSNVNIDIIKILSRHRGTCFEFLQTAIELGNKDMVQVILQNADARNLRNSHTTALHIALHQQNTHIAKMLLEHGCEADLVNFAGVTPLLVAVSTDNIAIVEILLSKGADINFQEEDSGVTALFIAALKENRSMVRKLLQYGANKNVNISKDPLFFVIQHLTWCDIDFGICDTSEIISKVKRIIEEESTDVELKKNVKVRKTLLGKIWHLY
ncbi:Ankyrin repeat-containing protein [Oryctes borbonicus]|uniref:Ankyrin repeat-containing protein n=1 Tax=Oryctes borbonicus TaxID=1629725 RepID=A0A0T6BAR5_9SCAR|nr:Ankyrin repeat-containing protein [Oryctes borbonicus]